MIYEISCYCFIRIKVEILVFNFCFIIHTNLCRKLINGGPSWTRTSDPRVINTML